MKLTRRVAPGTTVSVLQLTGDSAATGLSLGHGRTWGRWEAEIGLWLSSDTANMGLDTSSSGFDFSVSRSVARALRLGAGLDGPLVRGQLASLTLQYAPGDRTNVALAVRRWYGATTILELRGWQSVGKRWQIGVAASSEATLSLFAKRRF